MTESKSDRFSADEAQLADFFVTEDEAVTASYVGALDTEPTTSREVAELLTFWVGDEEFAVDILEIQEILKVPEVTSVPRIADSVLGIISLRGTIVPVVDARTFLRVEPREPRRESRVLVLRAHGEPVGLLVDRVVSVQRIDRESIEAVPRTMQRDTSAALAGVGRFNDRLLIILDLQAIFDFLEKSI